MANFKNLSYNNSEMQGENYVKRQGSQFRGKEKSI